MKLTRAYLSKLLPGFNRKPTPTKKPAASAAATPVPQTKPTLTVAPPKPSPPPINGAELLDSIARFLRQYLVCDDYQFTLLALWIVHTWCFRQFSTAAYLYIHSTEQSAKTLCLRLLAALCDSPWLATGAHWRSIMGSLLTSDRRLVPGKPFVSAPPHTILLDDCQHTFGPSQRQPVLAMLNSGSQASCNYLDGLKRYCVFGPKAFASSAALPSSLAGRCIPITLRRKKPSDVIVRFTDAATASAVNLASSLQSWVSANSAAVARQQAPARLPAGLNARQQDCAEPLLHIADRVGGTWPEKARAALNAAFKTADDSSALELLADIRAIFFLKEDPSYLPTHDLLTGLIHIEYRPWAAWSTRSGRRLAGLLHPFGINPRNFTKGSASSFRGYPREEFLDAWERYLPPIPADWPDIRAAMKKQAAANAS